MKWATKRRARTLLVTVAIVAGIATLVARLSRMTKDGRPRIVTVSGSQTPVAAPTIYSVQSQTNSTDVQPTSPAIASPTPNTTSNAPTVTSSSSARLIIPVAGVQPEQLRDTFSEARSEGRVHDAIDILAPRGTPVIAAADGPIVKLFHSERGGTTIYQLSTDGKFVYYYAHLERYAESLAEGHFAKQGETIAYVGDTGNAGPGNYHLHFSIAEISNPKDFWHGVNINPYPLLRK
jgi:murein DD-endopeptidase MepM/ murein hydrolase activator NlpD